MKDIVFIFIQFVRPFSIGAIENFSFVTKGSKYFQQTSGSERIAFQKPPGVQNGQYHNLGFLNQLQITFRNIEHTWFNMV
jgi:hypothetical protein